MRLRLEKGRVFPVVDIRRDLIKVIARRLQPPRRGQARRVEELADKRMQEDKSN